MYEELKETDLKTCTQIVLEHRGLAYLMINVETEVEKNGILSEPKGTLYAVADKEGLSELYSTATRFKEDGIEVIFETSPLDADKLFVLL